MTQNCINKLPANLNKYKNGDDKVKMIDLDECGFMAGDHLMKEIQEKHQDHKVLFRYGNMVLTEQIDNNNYFSGNNYCTHQCNADGSLYWGHYTMSVKDALKDLAERIDSSNFEKL